MKGIMKRFSIMFASLAMVFSAGLIHEETNGAKAADKTYSYTFNASAFSGTNQTISLGNASWTLNNDGSFYSYDKTKGQQIGSSNKPAKNMTLETNDFKDYAVKSIIVNTSGGSKISATLSVSFDGTNYEDEKTISASATNYTFANANNYSGATILKWTQTSSKAIYIKSISITYEETTSDQPILTNVSVSGTPKSPQYVGNVFDYEGLTFTPIYDRENSSPETITGDMITWPTLTSEMVETGKVSGNYKGVSVDVNNVTIKEDEIISIQIEGDLDTKEYTTDMNFITDGLIVNAVYESGKKVQLTHSLLGWTFSTTPNELGIGENKSVNITATYNGKSASIEITGLTINKVDTYTLVKDSSELSTGDEIVIASAKDNVAMSSTQKESNRPASTIEKLEDDGLKVSADTQIIILEQGKVEDTFAFKVDDGYLYASSSSSNQLKTNSTLNENGSWKITVANNIATIKAQGTNSRSTMQYNTSAKVFSCYSSASQSQLAIYKKIKDTAALDKFIDDVNAIEEITLENYNEISTTIASLKTEYEALSDSDKANINVINAKATLDAKENATYFVGLVASSTKIDSLVYDEKTKAEINGLRADYEDLTVEEKAYAKNGLAQLELLEERMIALEFVDDWDLLRLEGDGSICSFLEGNEKLDDLLKRYHNLSEANKEFVDAYEDLYATDTEGNEIDITIGETIAYIEAYKNSKNPNSANSNVLANISSNSSLLIIILIGILGLTSIAGYYFINKRKYNNQ